MKIDVSRPITFFNYFKKIFLTRKFLGDLLLNTVMSFIISIKILYIYFQFNYIDFYKKLLEEPSLYSNVLFYVFKGLLLFMLIYSIIINVFLKEINQRL